MKRIIPILMLVMAAACSRGKTHEPAAFENGETKLRITGPYAHENLAVYLLHSDKGDDSDFMTLDEGLKDGTVTVTEKGEGQVSELILENSSSRALFIQEGDRVKGGKQDRIIGLSFVVPAKSGKMPVPSFCVEQGRWAAAVGVSKMDSVFVGGENDALAQKSVRAAAKAGKDQSEVWREVGGVKKKAEQALGTENTNSNLNETMDSEKAKKAVEPYVKGLEGILVGKPDVIGVAFALNGKVEEVNIYPGRKLLAKLYPRLLGSYALAAVIEKKTEAHPTAGEIAEFMKESREKSKRTEAVAENSVTVRDLEANVQCMTDYQGKRVHSQWMRRDESSRPAAGNEGQQRQQVEEQNQTPRR